MKIKLHSSWRKGRRRSQQIIQWGSLTYFALNNVVNLCITIFTLHFPFDFQMESLSHKSTRQNYCVFSASYCITFIVHYLLFIFFFLFTSLFYLLSDQCHPYSQLHSRLCTYLRMDFHYLSVVYLLSAHNVQGSLTVHCIWESACRSNNTLWSVSFMLCSKSNSLWHVYCISLYSGHEIDRAVIITVF